MEHTNFLLYVGFIFVLAYLNKVFSKKANIPEVTGYVILGVIAGKSVLGVFSADIIDHLSSLSSVALALIAFTIGIELKIDTLKKIGSSIILIVLFEVIGAFSLVFVVMQFVLHQPVYVSILLASVASATAPAATVAVIRQYKAKGKLTSTILAVVGIDDAAALIVYVLAASFAQSLIKGDELNILSTVGESLMLLSGALVLGTIAAFLFLFILKKVRNDEFVKILLVAFLMLLLGLSEAGHLSELLVIMVFGFVVTNSNAVLTKKCERITEFLTPIFLAVFFTMGGAMLDVSAILVIGGTGLFYFVSRSVGKVAGATIGGYLGRAPKEIKNYIGFALLPQVGVALALAISIHKTFTNPIYGQKGQDLAAMIINILLFTTILTEIIGPLLTKKVLIKAGEIQEDK